MSHREFSRQLFTFHSCVRPLCQTLFYSSLVCSFLLTWLICFIKERVRRYWEEIMTSIPLHSPCAVTKGVKKTSFFRVKVFALLPVFAQIKENQFHFYFITAPPLARPIRSLTACLDPKEKRKKKQINDLV